MASTVGKIVKRVFLWNGVYVLDWRELPDDGLYALRREVNNYMAQTGINADPDFSNMQEDIQAEITRREQNQ